MPVFYLTQALKCLLWPLWCFLWHSIWQSNNTTWNRHLILHQHFQNDPIFVQLQMAIKTLIVKMLQRLPRKWGTTKT